MEINSKRLETAVFQVFYNKPFANKEAMLNAHIKGGERNIKQKSRTYIKRATFQWTLPTGPSGAIGLFKKTSKINGYRAVTSDNNPLGGEENH